MDEFVSRKLKELGNDYFLTEFVVNNPTNSPVNFDLFNSNTNTSTPDNLTFQPLPTILGSSYNTSNTITQQYQFAVNTQNNNIYAFDSSYNNVNVFNNGVFITSINLLGLIGGIMIYNPINNRLYVGCNTVTGVQLIVIDCSINATIFTPIAINPTVIFPSTQQILTFSLDFNTNEIYLVRLLFTPPTTFIFRLDRFDCNTNLSIFRVNFTPPPAQAPQRFNVYSPTNNFIYFGRNNANLTAYSINLNTLFIVPISLRASACVYNTQNNLLYVGESFLGVNRIDIINPNANLGGGAVINSILLNPTISSIAFMAYNSFANCIYILDNTTNLIANFDCNTNTIVSTTSTLPNQLYNTSYIIYNPNNNSNTFSTSDGVNFSLNNINPAPIPFVGGSTTYTYNQFNEDKKYQPFLLDCMMIYSNNVGNLNQVFDAQVKDANGQIAKDPKFPALQISKYQFQASVAKVCFGKKGRGGFILDQESSFTNFTVQPNSNVKLVLIQKQLKESKNFTKPITLCQKLDPSVNPKLKIAPPKKKELPKGKPKPKDKKPLASKPIKSFFQEICSRMDGEQEILQDSVNNAMSNFQLKINNSEVEEDKSVNLGVPLVIIGGIVVAFSLSK